MSKAFAAVAFFICIIVTNRDAVDSTLPILHAGVKYS